MKDYYKISEISKLYGIGMDSLRYYEKLGIIKPHRDTNGYRLYNLKDMYKLTIIRDLRELHFPMEQIREFLDGLSVEHTIRHLYKEQDILSERIRQLQSEQRIMQERLEKLEKMHKIEAGIIEIKACPERVCVRLNEHITRDEEMDFMIKKLHKMHEGKIRSLGNQLVGGILSMEALQKGIANVYDSVFFVLEDKTKEYDFVLPAGKYLSCYYRGAYEQNGQMVQEMKQYALEHKIVLRDSAFELYIIDNRDTIQESEFLTEIQIFIQEQADCSKFENNAVGKCAQKNI